MKSVLRRAVEYPVEHRIAGLVNRGQQSVRPSRVELVEVEPAAPELSVHGRLEIARQAIITRLAEEVSRERRAVLTRRDLAKIVNAAVHAYCVRHALEMSQLGRRDFITDIMQALLTLDQNSSAARQGSQLTAAQVAKAQLMPLIIEQMDIAAASDMPRTEFETQLTGWVKRLLVENKIQLNFAEQRAVIELLIDDMLGLGPLEPLISDESVADIMVNGPNKIYVERRGKLELSDVAFRDEAHLMNICTKIVTRIGRRVDESQPLVDARLPDGSRVNIIIPPLAIDGAMISIRKFSKKSITLDTLVNYGSISAAMSTLLKVAARARLNILISGGTGSGKTTLLNALSRMIDGAERTITIEDAAELQLQQPHVGRLETRTANLEGTGEIKMRELLRNALRMRPDRIIIGECRGEETLDMLQAMNTGHAGSMTTIHANSPREALTRLENMVGMAGVSMPSRAIRSQIASAVDLICQVNRMRDGQRRVTHITEVIGLEGDIITTQDLFTYEFEGEGPDGRLHGTFEQSGLRPNFMPKAAYYGLDKILLELV